MQIQFQDQKIILHQGVYKPSASVADAIFMITGMTIGAGVLGVPYVVAQVGLKIGIVYILALGLVMLALNLMLGEIAVRTNQSLQIPGLVGKYLGKWAKYFFNISANSMASTTSNRYPNRCFHARAGWLLARASN